MFDNNVDNRILIFGTDESLNFLASADAWFTDGTFTVAPPQFAQMKHDTWSVWLPSHYRLLRATTKQDKRNVREIVATSFCGLTNNVDNKGS